MTIPKRPDLAGAIQAHLLVDSEIRTATSYRVSPVIQSGADNPRRWPLPCRAIKITTGRGGSDEDGAIRNERVDLTFYGSTDLDAMDLFNLVDSYLIPDSLTTRTSFHQKNTRVYTVSLEGGPNRLEDPDTRWPYVMATYRFRYSKVRTA